MSDYQRGVARYDRGELRPVRRMPDGRLIVDAYFTRAGVFAYPDSKYPGGQRLELRPPEEVFARPSMDSFGMLPFVNGHPPVGLLDADSARDYMVGATGERVERDGDYMRGTIMVADRATADLMEAGKTQLSNGYRCDIDPTPGRHPTYGAYHVVQRNIRGNHVARVDEGRAGAACAARMDSMGAYCDPTVDSVLTAAARHRLEPSMFADPAHEGLPLENEEHVRAAMSRFGQEHFSTPEAKRAGYHKILARAKELGIKSEGFQAAWSGRLDLGAINQGLQPPAARATTPNMDKEAALRALEQEVTDLKKANGELEKEVQTQTKRADAAEAERGHFEKRAKESEAKRLDEREALEAEAVKTANARADKLQKELDGHNARFDAAVRERSVLISKALAVLGSDKDTAVAAMTAREIQVEMIKRLDSAEDVSDKRSDAALEALADRLYRENVENARAFVRQTAVLDTAAAARREEPSNGTKFTPLKDAWREELPSAKLRNR